MPTTIEEEIEYNDLMNAIDSVLFLIGLFMTMGCCIYCIIKKEEYLGVVFKPEVDSVVFINRGVADIFERHAILSELKTTNDIDTNRGGLVRI